MFHKEGQKIIFVTLVFVVATSLLIDNLQMRLQLMIELKNELKKLKSKENEEHTL